MLESLGDEDDDELDAKTDPRRSFANPFDPAPKATVKSPVVGNKPGMTTKPQMAPPSKPKDDFGNPLTHTQAKVGGKETGISKPPYKGDFVGQVWRTAGKTQNKRAAWQDKASGEWRGRNVQSQGTDEVVWDGTDWVTPSAFQMKAKSGGLKK